MSESAEQPASPPPKKLEVWTCGCGHDGRLGLGPSREEFNKAHLTRVPFFQHRDVKSIHVGGFHTFVRCADGVYGFGFNEDGQLGTGSLESMPSPVRVTFFGDGDDLIDLQCGAYHSIALMKDGVYVTGKNDQGQLGLGDRDSRKNFTKVPECPNTGVKAIACGSYHSVIVLENILLSCGRGDFGELGYDADDWDLMAAQEARVKRSVAQFAAVRQHAESDVLSAEQEPPTSGMLSGQLNTSKNKSVRRPEFSHPTFKMVPFEGFGTVSAVKCGHNRTSVVGTGEDGASRVFSFGCKYCWEIDTADNSIPQPLCPPASSVADVLAGDEILLALGVDGSLHYIGRPCGQEDPPSAKEWTPVPLADADGNADGVGLPMALHGVNHVLMECAGGQVMAFGDNYMGQLGLGDEVDRPAPTRVPLPSGMWAVSVGAGFRHSVFLLEAPISPST